MEPDVISTRPETLQNSLAKSHGMDRGFCWCTGEGAHHTGTEANLTKTGSTSRLLGCETWYKYIRQLVLVLHCLQKVALCLCWEVGEMAPNGGLPYPRRGASWTLPLRDCTLRRANYLSPVCPRHSSDLCLHPLGCLSTFPSGIGQGP